MARTPEWLELRAPEDIVPLRRAVRRWAVELGFGLVDQTKIVTAASELGRNAVLHGGGGRALLEALQEGGLRGLRLTVTDQGPASPTWSWLCATDTPRSADWGWVWGEPGAW